MRAFLARSGPGAARHGGGNGGTPKRTRPGGQTPKKSLVSFWVPDEGNPRRGQGLLTRLNLLNSICQSLDALRPERWLQTRRRQECAKHGDRKPCDLRGLCHNAKRLPNTSWPGSRRLNMCKSKFKKNCIRAIVCCSAFHSSTKLSERRITSSRPVHEALQASSPPLQQPHTSPRR